MEKHPLYGKKKRKIGPSPNQLFCQWLQEWRDEAAEKGWKSQYIYGKAFHTLKKYPLPMSSGKECKMLENFGDKICKMLDDKLAKHIEVHGCVDTVSLGSSIAATSRSEDVPKQKKKTTPKRHQPSAKSISIAFSSESGDENERMAAQPKRKRKSSGQGRDYIPAVGSGAYALLLTLYRNQQHPNSQGFMTKSDLTREAQPLAEKSFTIMDPGCRYTAWSSMGTLIKKHLVIKEKCPAKYSLTDAGCEIAHKLHIVQERDVFMNGAAAHGIQRDAPINRASEPARVPSLPDIDMPSRYDTMESDSEAEMEIPVPDLFVPREKTTSSFKYDYVREDDTLVVMKDQAAVLIDDEISIGFLIRCVYTDLLASGKRYKLDTSRPLGEHVYAYLHNDDADDVANPAHNDQTTHAKTAMSHPRTELSESSELYRQQDKGKPDVTTAKRKKKTDKEQTGTLPLSLNLPSSSISSFQPVPTPSTLDSLETDSVISVSSTASSLPSLSSITSTRGLSKPDFVLYPSTFDIVLCVDNCEFYGSSNSYGKTLLPDLIKNGVETDLRKLHVGDLLWIAREKVASIPGQLAKPKGRELVLDYIIERKRMDDLVHSSIDGRFKEQKFRLKHCGLRHPIYLVEDYGSAKHFSISEDKIKQTITNTQVIDEFQVKRTKDTKESVAYLTVMTRYLQSFYHDKTLYACSPDEIEEFNEMKSIDDIEMKLMTFEDFNQGSVKNKDLTATELFGKQLIQLYGMSAERAKAIVETYPTLAHLISSYDECSTEKEKENMLANIKAGKSSRNLGVAQSKMIYHLYCTTGPLH